MTLMNMLSSLHVHRRLVRGPLQALKHGLVSCQLFLRVISSLDSLLIDTDIFQKLL